MTDKQIIVDAFNSAWNRKVATESSYGKLASKEVFENNNEDKQIIIDGVDVSGCELYREDNGVFAPDGTAERTELCYLTNDYCANNPNCYYKQLKAKEQECETLEKAIKLQKGFLEHTEKECEELKEENKKLKDEIDDLITEIAGIDI